MLGNRVCVLGGGPLGLVATKNLAEQGMHVTTFEKGSKVGGIWTIRDGQLSVLPTTTKNTSKQVSSFTDLRYPKDAKTHPSAKQVETYLDNYADTFDILKHFRFDTEVVAIRRDEHNTAWVVTTKSTKGSNGATEVHHFDRVVVASGLLSVAKMPRFQGSERFQGDLMHSREFKDPSKYEGKRVIVVGVGATGVDIASFIVKAKAKQVYLSHRAQMLLLPRMVAGKAFDHNMSRRLGLIMRRLMAWIPGHILKFMANPMVAARQAAYPWLSDHPSFNAPRKMDGLPYRVPMFSDDLAYNIRQGAVQTTQGIEEITGPRSVRMTDGTELDDIDAIVVCSGYTYDLSFLQGPGNPCDPALAPDGFKAHRAAKYYDPDYPFARLYQGILSEQYPDSLAILGHMLIMKPPFVVADLATMAIASLWSGSYPGGMPSKAAMRADIDKQYDFVVKMCANGPIHYPGFRMSLGEATYKWLNTVAGTGVLERIGNWGPAAFRLWWQDRKFYNLLMDGIDCPATYRLFDTPYGRKSWKGAKQAILDANEEVRAMGEQWKKEEADKKSK
ncbi:flavin-binding monooxygenase-like-domain-containing protein [Microdochium trichocladiopsis]|uniref:Flavin-binding monooxygenase-like-domain-containing protein n=1 Tax=Microdochium trichocladiopsis TaxID=1682393 RepID=A0A9P8Y1K8_9PEZI|nr:flavin-binding monooxygenase-like-domain-containing protein [Microdochium trichocladiopsis]KAH7028754.1 flavin-binding monooxygenase-like-domain-containing protein [Microdochium trichocladiopsis]